MNTENDGDAAKYARIVLTVAELVRDWDNDMEQPSVAVLERLKQYLIEQGVLEGQA